MCLVIKIKKEKIEEVRKEELLEVLKARVKLDKKLP